MLIDPVSPSKMRIELLSLSATYMSPFRLHTPLGNENPVYSKILDSIFRQSRFCGTGVKPDDLFKITTLGKRKMSPRHDLPQKNGKCMLNIVAQFYFSPRRVLSRESEI